MPDITSLVPPKTDQPSPQQLPARGVVVAAPAALTDPTLTVVVPSHSTTYSLDLRWIRQGAAIPAAGADCKVVFDETGEGVVVWWAGGGALPAALDIGNASLGLRIGASTATWTASTTSAGVPITHGLGRTPVLAAAFQNGNTALLYGASAIGATTFTVTGFYTDHATSGNLTGTFSFGWVALG